MEKLRRAKLLRVPLIFLLCVVLIAETGSHLTASPKTGGLDHFPKKNQYTSAMFSDVRESDWFYENVKAVYEYGLMIGDSPTKFRPNGNVTIAETITLAARLHSIYQTGKNDFETSTPWYQVYIDYAESNGIIRTAYQDYNRAATRAEYAVILAAAFPEQALKQINQIPDNTIPDVKISDTYGEAVYRLYRAGVLTGSDGKGTFHPNSNIRRSEVAAIISRMADADQRVFKNDYADAAGEEQPSSGATQKPVEEELPIYSPSFVLETVEAHKGDKNVAVTVSLKNNPGIASVGLLVSYDSAITLRDIDYNEAMGGQTMLPPIANNPFKIIWISLNEIKEDCALATLYFDVNEDAAPGHYQIAAVYDENDVYDMDMNNVAFKVINGAIYVTE